MPTDYITSDGKRFEGGNHMEDFFAEQRAKSHQSGLDSSSSGSVSSSTPSLSPSEQASRASYIRSSAAINIRTDLEKGKKCLLAGKKKEAREWFEKATRGRSYCEEGKEAVKFLEEMDNKSSQFILDFISSASKSLPTFTSYEEVKNFTGYGKFIYDNGDIFEGNIYSGHLSEGKKIFANGDIYEGEFFNGVPMGKGKRTYADGKVKKGKWDGSRLKGLFG